MQRWLKQYSNGGSSRSHPKPASSPWRNPDADEKILDKWEVIDPGLRWYAIAPS